MDTITHEKTPDTHSGIVGGSSAARVLGCPGSVDLLAKLDEQIEASAFGLEMETQDAMARGATVEAEELLASAKAMRASKNASSSYADEGTGLHEIMAYLVENDVDINTLMTDPKVDELWEKYDLHLDRMYDAVVPAYKSFLAYLDTLYEKFPGCELELRIETKVEMPGIAGAFGTCDVLITVLVNDVAVFTVVWDWKMGQGTPYYAFYETSEGKMPNEQLSFYARAALHTVPHYFGEDTPVELVICWPRGNEELSTIAVTQAYLEDFRLDLIDAVEEAQSGKGQLKKGSYCRFAKCKSICPLHLNGATAMAEIGEKLAKLQMHAASETTMQGSLAVHDPLEPKYAYADALAAMLTLSEIVEPYIKEAYAQAHAFMEAGGEVPGHKLVPKKAGWDSWNDRDEVDSFLSRRKLAVEERRKPWEPITPAVARKVLKSKGDEKGVKLLEKYVKPGVSSGTTIAPSDDPREAVQATATMVAELANKIASL
jgi:hypothetical protein